MVKFDENNNVIVDESFFAIIVGVEKSNDKSGDSEYSVSELKGLVEAAGGETIGIMTQRLERPNTATYIGSGKVGELAEMADNMEADTIIFNNELSGMQIRNLEDITGKKVIDRTILILDIFARRAISKEGKLQVELAQLKYRLPRLTGFGKSLSRLGGGVGTRGPGEKKIELDRRHIERRLQDIRNELNEIDRTRKLQRESRENREIPIVALVGYTNVGKSAIMNHILCKFEKDDKNVVEKDMLFATLDAKHRGIELDKQHKFVLVDTVGFVSRLPHSLVSAFKSTLEEAAFSDLIINVVDYSNKDNEFQQEITKDVLADIGASDIPMITVYNKVDLADNKNSLSHDENIVFTSAKTGENMDLLLETIKKKIFDIPITANFIIPYDKGSVSSEICRVGNVISMEYKDDGVHIAAELKEKDFGRVKNYAII